VSFNSDFSLTSILFLEILFEKKTFINNKNKLFVYEIYALFVSINAIIYKLK